MEHRRPKAGDAPHEGLLKVERREFRCLGVQVLGLGFWEFGCFGWFWEVLGVLGFRGFRI